MHTGGVTLEYEEQPSVYTARAGLLVQTRVQAGLNHSQIRREGNFIISGRPRGLSKRFLAYVLGRLMNVQTHW